jgi:hypothetical protein
MDPYDLEHLFLWGPLVSWHLPWVPQNSLIIELMLGPTG